MTVSRSMWSVVLVFALVGSASAQVCGNGVLELGETCDDGNLVAGDCCSPTCVRAIAGQPCRAPVNVCDLIEVCDGVSFFCPADTGIIGDGDGDGLCDPLDGCPADFDPEHLDRDFDGVGDVCDPCTNVAETEVERAKLRLRKLDQRPGTQRVKLRGELTVPASPPIDPVANGLRMLVHDDNGKTLMDVTVPAGEYDPFERRGWTTNGTGLIFRYVDKAATAGGIKRVLVKQRLPGHLRVVAFGQGGDYGVPTSEVIHVTVVAAPPVSDTQCGEARFAAGKCRFRNQGGKLVCR